MRKFLIGSAAIIALLSFIGSRDQPSSSHQQQDKEQARQILSDALEQSKAVPFEVTVSFTNQGSSCLPGVDVVNASKARVDALVGQIVLSTFGSMRTATFGITGMMPGERHSATAVASGYCGRDTYVERIEIARCVAQTVGQPAQCFVKAASQIRPDGKVMGLGTPPPPPVQTTPTRQASPHR